MTIAHNLGYSRMGPDRELKKALEAYWSGEIDESFLQGVARSLRARHWSQQDKAGLDLAPVGDFSLYDHMLDMTVLLGAVPHRYGNGAGLETYFAMARGGLGQPAMEMTKWFDTNYHYIVPEFTADTRFRAAPERLLAEIEEARAAGVIPKPVLVGPLTYLYLGKSKEDGFERLTLLPGLVNAYKALLAQLAASGVEWVQLDEPALVYDLPAPWLAALDEAYESLAGAGPRILLATYFDGVGDLAGRLKALPVAGLHLDLVRAPEQLKVFLNDYPADRILSLGVVDGRNVWRCDLDKALALLRTAKKALGDRLWIAPSCSLLHCPVDLDLETRLDDELRAWLAFGRQKLDEVVALKRGLDDGEESIQQILTASRHASATRRSSPRIHDPAVEARMRGLTDRDARRDSPFAERRRVQRDRFDLPLFPTTTIGSFPQTAAIRRARAQFRRGELQAEDYRGQMEAEIALAIRKQEELGLDVLVHGEPERNDMVEYFGEQLRGYAFTDQGWVQSYGSRCVKPPIIFGDVSRPVPMTVEWARYAQSLTDKPVKGMLTGPVTMLQWSFVRDDQPRSATALQIALAIRDEVVDLEQAGIGIIQIDEPALREGLPLKKEAWQPYLDWAGHAFRVAASGVEDRTQIHTHMCYAEFGDILPAIAALDADVITIETSRSAMELLEDFGTFRYPNEIGPGVYDIHSPRVPGTEEMQRLLEKALTVVPKENLWVNPDCGLKTRGWPEVEGALAHMVEAAQRLRQKHAPQQV